MKTKLFSLVLAVVVGFNAFVLLSYSKVSAGGGIIKGLKGHINGVDTCHCPDDAGTCNCAVATE